MINLLLQITEFTNTSPATAFVIFTLICIAIFMGITYIFTKYLKDWLIKSNLWEYACNGFIVSWIVCLVYSLYGTMSPTMVTKGMCFERNYQSSSDVFFLNNEKERLEFKLKILMRKMDFAKKMNKESSLLSEYGVINRGLDQINLSLANKSKSYPEYFLILDNIENTNIAYNITREQFSDGLNYNEIYSKDNTITKRIKCTSEMNAVVYKYNHGNLIVSNNK